MNIDIEIIQTILLLLIFLACRRINGNIVDIARDIWKNEKL
ncbi:MAG: hypothetical protein ACRCVJ_18480 [Clostridium sp.]